MPETLTIEEIESRFASERVLVEDPTTVVGYDPALVSGGFSTFGRQDG